MRDTASTVPSGREAPAFAWVWTQLTTHILIEQMTAITWTMFIGIMANI